MSQSGLVVQVNNHTAGMNHLIICALIDCFDDFPLTEDSEPHERAIKNAYHHIDVTLGAVAATTFNGIIRQHYGQYKKECAIYASKYGY